jgi:hypothetical protein
VKKILLLCIIFALSFASDFIPREKLESLSSTFVQQRQQGACLLDGILTYYGIDDQPNAYAMVYRNANGEPFTIVVGARYTCTPISEYSRSLPNYYKTIQKASTKASEILEGEQQFGRIYYFGPQEEYFSFASRGREILVNTYSLEVVDKATFFAERPERSAALEALLRVKWDEYLDGSDFMPRDTGYIDSVPFVLWTYGCSPTAASMLLWYWDSRGYGRLVDYFFDRWDPPENEWDYNIPNVARELAIAMYTDTMSGASYGQYFVQAFNTVANSINGYSFSGIRYSPGNAGNQYLFNYLRNEIDNQRPCLWSVYNHYPQVWPPPSGHSLTGIGYDIALPDTFVIVHNTWDYTEPHWALWTYYNGVYSEDGVTCVFPAGPNSNNTVLTFPQQGGIMFKNLRYYLRWETTGSEIDHLKMWYSIGRQSMNYDSLNWILIDQNLPNTGRYLWTVPAEDSAFRINISGLNSSNTRLAADGSLYRVLRDTVEHSPEVSMVGHFDTDGSCLEAVRVGDYLYAADYLNGLLVFDAADSSVLDLVGHVTNIGEPRALCYQSPYLYVADNTDTFRIFDLTDPQTPTQLGHIGIEGTPRRVFVQGNYAFLSCTVAGMIIIDCADANYPEVEGVFDSPGQTYDVFVSDTIAYIADGSAGLRMVNVSVPSSPSEISYYDPMFGITQAVEKNGDYLYLADGSIGIRILHLTAPATVESLSVFDTPGVAKDLEFEDNLLFVADGVQGMRVVNVIDPQTPQEAGYLESGSATTLCAVNNLVYLADDADGVYVIYHNITHVDEYEQPEVAKIMFECPSIANVTRGITFNVNLTERALVTINLYDLAGRLVDNIHAGLLERGTNHFHYDRKISSGVYFLVVEEANVRIPWKLLVVK